MTGITVISYKTNDKTDIKLMMDSVEDCKATTENIQDAMKKNWPEYSIARIFIRKKK